MSVDTINDEILLKATNIGGIAEDEIQLNQGINILTGKNATNRTSFLKALAASLGSTDIALRGDNSEGSVELSFNDEYYKRTIYDEAGSNVYKGDIAIDPDDVRVAELFAFLFERNPARRAIREEWDLRDIVMEPIDTEEIQQQIDSKRELLDEKESRLEELKSLQRQLPSLKERKEKLAEEIADLETTIESKQTELETAEAEVDESQEQKQEIEAAVSELHSKQSDLESTQSKITNRKERIKSLEADLEADEQKLSELPPVDTDRLEEIRAELDELHERRARKETMMSELQNVIQFNKDIIEDKSSANQAFSTLASRDKSGSTSDQLVNDSLVCWTCGTETTQQQIENTLTQLQSVHEDLYGEREHLQSQIDQLTTEKKELEQQQRERSDLQDSIDELSSQLEQSRQTIETLEEREDELIDEIASAEEEIESLREERDSQILDLHREINELEVELQRRQEERETVDDEIAEIEAKLETEEELQAEVQKIKNTIEDLQGRVKSIQEDAVANFNEHMATVLEILEYENIDRIWLERREVEVRKGRKKVEEAQFDLHVIRQNDDGKGYEDRVRHLSESEREVTGLIFALAGYLTYDVYEKVPFMILDSLEAIDSERIAKLIEYLSDYADNIAVALLPEDAQALPDNYTRITEFA